MERAVGEDCRTEFTGFGHIQNRGDARAHVSKDCENRDNEKEKSGHFAVRSENGNESLIRSQNRWWLWEMMISG
jgi:hypothetical protein